jgi:phospholipid/cholesterol/gamma-HCH transport system ATP-binding protein
MHRLLTRVQATPLAQTANAPTLVFDRVTLATAPEYASGVWDVRLQLQPGELAVVRTEASHMRVPLADLAQGLVDPEEGQVRCFGLAWEGLDTVQAERARARTGRVFEGGGWIGELSVTDNVLLGQRYHAQRPESELLDEAAQLAQLFGLPGLPTGRPHQLREEDLQRANCVRCFLGRPELVLLEHPTTGVYPEIMPALVNAIGAARQRGAAVLWITASHEILLDAGLRPTHRALMSGAQFLPIAVNQQ